MQRVRAFACFFLIGAIANASEEQWLRWLSPALLAAEREEAGLRRELAALGAPLEGQTVSQVGFLYRTSATPVTLPWVQIDLRRSQAIDWIVLIPAQVGWQTADRQAYGFPPRFRIDVSNEANFSKSVQIAEFDDQDFPDTGTEPVPISAGGVVARYVRLTVTKLAIEDSFRFFALAEMMVTSGRRNIAIGCPVVVSAAKELEPRWSKANLVDGRTPLGPPAIREVLPYDGLYSGPPPNETPDEPVWIQVDLGKSFPLQEVRVHPVHAWIGADVPGHAFPRRFRIEADDDETFAHPSILFDTGEKDYPPPGNNAVIARAENVTARFVRFVLVTPERGPAGLRHVGLSEFEVYSGDMNVARSGTVTLSAEPPGLSRAWPKSLLVDGFTSLGRLLELPDWVAYWQRRIAVGRRLSVLDAEKSALLVKARSRAWWAGGLLLMGALTTAAVLTWQNKRRRERDRADTRTRLARDLHDEIGSNLAGLAVLSETLGNEREPATRDDWREVNRIARETNDAMREVLWLAGTREESGFDLMKQMERAAARMLVGRKAQWRQPLATVPPGWTTAVQRETFLFFKEALANVVRHSQATEVWLAATVEGGVFELRIEDNGRGFAERNTSSGMGLSNLRERARQLGGSCAIHSAPGTGTHVVLRVPLKEG